MPFLNRSKIAVLNLIDYGIANFFFLALPLT
jgi:hypothetical protein